MKNREFGNEKLILILFTLLQSNIALAAKITAISVEGNRKVEADAIVASLDSKIGKELDPKLIEEDIHNIYQLGFFSDIRIFKESSKWRCKTNHRG